MTARGFASVGLDRVKSPENLGGVLRAAGCFGAAMVAVAGGRMGKYATDTMRSYRHIPCIEVAHVMDGMPYGCVPVVVELCPRAKPLERFTHPMSAYYVFGPEDGSVSTSIIERTQLIVKISSHACLNLAAAVNVVLYDRAAKRGAI